MDTHTVLDDYEDFTHSTSKFPEDQAVAYLLLGLGGEVGELQNFWKKRVRRGIGQPDSADELAMADELGDVLWYLVRLASELGWTLKDLAAMNESKLLSRQANDTITNLKHEDQS
mgnify:CR=1 FL=1